MHPWVSAAGGPRPPWIFKHNTDEVEGGLMVLFFGLVFSVAPSWKFFLPTTLHAPKARHLKPKGMMHQEPRVKSKTFF